MYTASASDGNPGGEPQTYYDVLGVPENATIEEIKRAYYLLVRRYRPSEHPEKFQNFNQAHHTLSDARRRGEYDQTRRSSRRVQVLLDQAAVALDKDQQKAVTLLKNAIALAPDMTRPRHLLAYVLMRLEEYGIAERQYRWLIREMPRDETLRFRLARCLYTQNRLEEALKELRKAFYLNPRYHDALMLAAKMYEAMGDRVQTVKFLERAVANDATENFADLEGLMRLLLVHLQWDSPGDVEAVEQRILGIIPQDEAKATRALQRLLKRAGEFFEEGDYRLAAGLSRVAVRIENAESAKKADAIAFQVRVSLTVEAERICNDPLVDMSLRELFDAKYLDRSPGSQRGPRISAAIDALRERILDDPRALAGAVEYLKREYPNVTAEQEGLLQEIALRVAKRLELLNSVGRVTEDDLAPFVMPGGKTSTVAASDETSTTRRGVLGIFRGRR